MSPENINENINSVIGQNLKALRKRHKLSQRKFGAIMGVSFQQYQKYETGQNKLSVEKLYKIQRHFNVSYTHFFHNPGARTGETLSVFERIRHFDDKVLRQKMEDVVAILIN